MLPIICRALVLRPGHATGGARVLAWTCWGLRQQLIARWAEFQHSVVYYATDQCQKRLEACINAEGGHSEHLLWHCLPDIPVAIHHNRFFSEPPTTTGSFQSLQRLKERNKPLQSDEKFCNSQVSVVTFSDGWASGLQFVFLWDNTNNQNYVWIIPLKMTFFGFSEVK